MRLDQGAARILGRPLSAPERADSVKYLKLLRKWQRVQRLVGSDDPEWIVSHVILDSWLFLRVLPADALRILDLGAGAGIPSVPMKIVRRELAVTLVEARQRRASFLAEVIRQLGLDGCAVVAERAEAVAEHHRGAFDAVVMRCAGAPEKVVPLALGFVRSGGSVVISGPPGHGLVARGEWIEVDGGADGPRRFLVVSKPSQGGPPLA